MNKPSLSANTLFHFTNSIDNLENILKAEFYPNYSLENWDNIIGNNFQIGIPMVCFCDIPLSQIQNHTRYYGNYALGLTKEWGIKNKINPVLYTYKHAPTATYIFASTAMTGKKTAEDMLIDFSFYMKPYEGTLWRNGKYLDDTVRFYDEREWRFIPEIDEKTDRISKYISPAEFTHEEYRRAQAAKLESKKLSFEPNDIKYIIVNKENEIYDMAMKIRSIKGKFPHKDVEVLVTRIISMQHIKEDF